jgi:monoamine oxidase
LVRLADGSLRTMADARRESPEFDITRSWALPLDTPPTPTESLADYLLRIGFTEAQMSYVRRSFANAACEAPEQLSALSSVDEWTDTSAGDGDYRIVEGYDRLIDHLAQGLDIRLNTVITQITWGDDGVRVQTRAGETFTGENAIITLPVGVMLSGNVTFTPELPPNKREALAGLRMGPAIKLVYLFAQDVIPNGGAAFYSKLNPPMWWSPSYAREGVQGQVMTAFATGDWARELSAMGEQGALDFALANFRAELGQPDLTPVAAQWIHWTADEFALGGYSVAMPGAHNARALLAEPTPPLYWAGEATAKNAWGATVHGAYASGQRAAAEVLQQMQYPFVTAE